MSDIMYDNNLPVGYTETTQNEYWIVTSWTNVWEEKFTSSISWEAEYDDGLDIFIHKENKSLSDYIWEWKLIVPEFLISKII